MEIRDTNGGDGNGDAGLIALHALIWILKDDVRAERLLALTGMTPDDLRRRADARDVQVAVLGFLESHEPDLMACAKAIDVTPLTIVQTRMRLEGA